MGMEFDYTDELMVRDAAAKALELLSIGSTKAATTFVRSGSTTFQLRLAIVDVPEQILKQIGGAHD